MLTLFNGFVVQAKIVCERNALYHWTIKDDNKSTLFLSNMSIHHETYARTVKDKRRESLHTRCYEQVNEIQSKINDLKINNKLWFTYIWFT